MVPANVFVVETSESAFLADPSGAVWTPTLAGNRGLPVLGISDASDGGLSEVGRLSDGSAASD